MLVNLPAYAADEHPAETQHAFLNFACHLSRTATDVFSSVMLTCGNGELCSKLFHNAINRAYVRRLKVNHSKAKEKKERSHKTEDFDVANYAPKDGVHIKTFPPLGDTMQDMFDEVCSSKRNPWCVSDSDQHTRKIQSVKGLGVFAQDHTFESIKNYKKRVGAKAAWTVGTETGETECVSLVPTTKTEDFTHAARQLLSLIHI